MSFGNSHNGGRTRMGTKVFLSIYDLSPANDFLWPVGFGLHHSGVEILGVEYSFASGGGVFESTPKQAPGAQFRMTVELGAFDGGQAELRQAISELRDSFGPDDYNLIRKNCNHFANALVWKMLGRSIPAYVNRLADIGFCCSCLLPQELLAHAPVGDPTDSGSRVSSSQSKKKTAVFTGQGAKLGSSDGRGGLFGFGGGSSSNRNDDLTDRREKARMAAMARMERGNTGSTAETEGETDKSR